MRHNEAYKLFRKKNLNELHERANGKKRSDLFLNLSISLKRSK